MLSASEKAFDDCIERKYVFWFRPQAELEQPGEVGFDGNAFRRGFALLFFALPYMGVTQKVLDRGSLLGKS